MLKIVSFGLLLTGCAVVATPLVNDRHNRVVDVVNPTEFAAQFYAVNAEAREFNRQRSAEGEVPARYYLTRNFADGSGACLYDFYADLANGLRAEQKRFDTCKEVSWVIGQ